jgi:hypothetical protein
MDDIEKARAKINKRVAGYIQSLPDMTYVQIAQALGVSRWRVLTVASRLGIARKTGPKRKNTVHFE